MRIELYQDSNGEYRWRMIAGNGRIVGESHQGFGTKDNCVQNLHIVIYDGHSVGRSYWRWV